MAFVRAHLWSIVALCSAIVVTCGCVVAAVGITRSRRAGHSQTQAAVWGSVVEAAQCVRDGTTPQTMGITDLIGQRRTRSIGIEALADMARAMPDANVVGWMSRSTRRCIEAWLSTELLQQDPGRRARCLEVAATLELVSCVGAVVKAAHDPSPDVRHAACRSLAVLDPEVAVGVLLGAIEEDDQEWAADLLQEIVARSGPSIGLPVLERFSMWAASPNLLAVIAGLSTNVEESLLLSALRSSNEAVVVRAVDALARAQCPSAASAFVALLGSPNDRVRLASVRALGRVGDPSALREAMPCVGDPSRSVRLAAAATISAHPAGRLVLTRLQRSSDPAIAEAAQFGLSYLLCEDPRGAEAPQASAFDLESAHLFDDLDALDRREIPDLTNGRRRAGNGDATSRRSSMVGM